MACLIMTLFTLMINLFVSNTYANERVYSISVIPMYAHEITSKYYSPLLAYLQKETGKKWELKFYNTHNDLITAFCKKEIDIAFTGPVPFVKIQNKCKANELIVSLGSHGKPFYNSVIFSSKKDIKTLKDLNGLKFGYLKASTLAHIVPFKMLDNEGVKIIPVAYKRQEEIVRAVMSGEVDAGGVKKSVFDKFQGQNIYIIGISEDIPNFLFFSQKDLDKNITSSFIQALTRLKPLRDNNHKKITENWDEEAKYGFVLPTNDYMQKVNQLWDWTQKYIKD
ncbi:MAG: PhnD/SsuA/transferrin family substrate-binding protein [Thermodesulfovibrionales bacterium]|nr:PhnD/SsuA/transferrin family substrate-binding protein [Thermodesulfovibrionales bacterium]